EVDGEIARLVDRSTQELRRAWRRVYHSGASLGLSCDLIIRGLADKLQQRAHGGPSRALQRRLRILAGEFEKGAGSFEPGGVLKTGASLVRRWRRHTHTVQVVLSAGTINSPQLLELSGIGQPERLRNLGIEV